MDRVYKLIEKQRSLNLNSYSIWYIVTFCHELESNMPPNSWWVYYLTTMEDWKHDNYVPFCYVLIVA